MLNVRWRSDLMFGACVCSRCLDGKGLNIAASVGELASYLLQLHVLVFSRDGILGVAHTVTVAIGSSRSKGYL